MKDNIIFWLDGDFTTFGLAKYIQDRHDCNISAIIDISDKPKGFFQQQKLIQFNKIWFYHDHINIKKKPDLKYLSDFEEKYHINLWLLAYNERLFFKFNYYHTFSDDDILSILEQECKLFETVLDDVKPDFLIIPQTNVHHTHLFHELCKAKGIKILMLGPSRFGYRCIISTDTDKIDEVIINSSEKIEETTWDDLENYLEKFNSFKNSSSWKKKFLTSKSKQLKAICKFLLSKNNNVHTHYTYFGRTKLRVFAIQLYYKIIETYRNYFINANLINELNVDKPFIYFPLHEEPESSLLLCAPFYTNQIEVITQIVKSLPIGYDLYVKEHFVMSARGWRELSFYKQLMKLPNVKLIHPSITPKQILEKCSLVITIGGTSGLEAALNKKPSIIFTDVDYAKLPSVKKINRIEELPEAIKASLKIKVNPIDIIKFTKFVEDNSFEFDLMEIGSDSNEHFFYGGFLSDVEVTDNQMKLFLDEHDSEFSTLAMEHIKKIQKYHTKGT